MFEWANTNISGIKFFYISDEDVSNHIISYQLESRYSQCKTISGTRSHHCFIPMSESSLIMKRISKDENGSKVFLKEKEAAVWSQLQTNDFLQPGQYVACWYD